jgi:hypothetical protein
MTKSYTSLVENVSWYRAARSYLKRRLVDYLAAIREPTLEEGRRAS